MAKHKINRRYVEQVQWAFERHRNANKLAEPGENDVILVLDGLGPKFNIGKIFRSAEVFSVKEVHIIKTTFFDVAPAKGGFKKVPAYFFKTFKDSYHRLTQLGYHLYALAPSEKQYLEQTKLPKKTAFILGHEQNGLSFSPKTYHDLNTLAITQYGETESLNVAVCASICLYEYCKQNSNTTI